MSKMLSYYDGMLKLVYSGGDAYHTDPPIARRTEIVFLCDIDAGDGHPQFETENNHTYTIVWYTAYACLPQAIECSVSDGKTGQRYDLSGYILLCLAVYC
jgi:insulin-like growth factor 2 receptor